MTRPIDETWSVKWDEYNGYDCMSSGHALHAGPYTVLAVFGSKAQPRHMEDPVQGARARLAAQAPAMARLLLKAYPNDSQCFACHHLDSDRPNHAPDCALIAVLRAAGVVD